MVLRAAPHPSGRCPATLSQERVFVLPHCRMDMKEEKASTFFIQISKIDRIAEKC